LRSVRRGGRSSAMSYISKEERQAINSLLETGYKRCGRCREIKPVSSFSPQTQNKTGLRPECKLCHNEVTRSRYEGERREMTLAWQRANNKTEHRRLYNRHYQRERYRRIREQMADHSRPDSCEACGGPGPVYYDHDHSRGGKRIGEFRGWLCCGCNTALGYAKNDPSILRKLADYLESYQARKGA